MSDRFARGFEAQIRHDVRVHDDLLIGGSPLRAVRLSSAARARIVDGRMTVHDATDAALTARLIDGNLADPVLHGCGPHARELTVIIPIRDRPEQLDRCLRALDGLRCIVVDDESHDPDAVTRVAVKHDARIISLPVNLGPAGARNTGLLAVDTPYVALVDSDVQADAAMLRRLARHFDDHRVALVGPLVRSRSRADVPRWFERYDEQVSSLALGRRACSVRPGAAVAWLPSACLVARVDRLRVAGGFAEEMRVGEDVDLVWRLVDSGEVVRYDPAETAWHDARGSVTGWLGRKFLYGTGGADLAARHGRTGAPAVISATMAISAAAVLVARPWSLPVAALGLLSGVRSLHRRLPPTAHRSGLAVQLATQGLGWAVRQEAALLLRHWWPLAAVGVLRSRSVRRALVTALLVDIVVAGIDHPEARYAPVSRRLDDLAYGAGLWVGALRARSVAALLPRRPGA